jgi:hypothetical protein
MSRTIENGIRSTYRITSLITWIPRKAWYLLRVGQQARSDAKLGDYQRDTTVASFLGNEPNKAKVDEQKVAVTLYNAKVGLQKEAIKAADLAKAELKPMGWRATSVVILFLLECAVNYVLFNVQLGFAPSWATGMAVMNTIVTFFIVRLIQQFYRTKRERLGITVVGIYAALAVALSYLRAEAQATDADSALFRIAVGFILVIISLGPSWLVDQFLQQIEVTAPALRKLRTMRRQLCEEERELASAKKTLWQLEKEADAYEDNLSTFQNLYDREYRRQLSTEKERERRQNERRERAAERQREREERRR